VERIAALLEDKEEPVRFMSAFALYRISKPLPGPKKAKKALKRASERDASFEVRAYALRALARRGGLDEAVLKRALDDESDKVAATALSVLGLVGEEKRCGLAASALSIAASRLEADAALIDKEFAHTARAALEAVSGCQTSGGVQEAAGRIEKNTEAEARLGLAGAAKVFCLARLVAGAGDLALVSCDQTRPHFGKQMLVKALERRIAAKPGEAGEDFQTLLEMMADPDLRVAIPALNAISDIPLPEASKAVLDSLDDDRSLMVAAALDAIAAHPDGFRDNAVRGIDRAVERFLPFEQAYAPVISAVSALTVLGDPAAEPILRRIAADSRPPIRHAVLGAYRAIDGIDPPAGLPELAPARPLSHEYLESWRSSKSRAIVRTTRGVIEIELFDGVSPGTVGSFVELSHAGYFDDTEIHRVVPNFVVQAGDPTGTGFGDPGYAIRCEVSPVPYERGTVGMALSGKDTGGSQFFITISRQPHLDGNYTVFGKVVSGMETADLVEEGDVILGITVTME
jgi:cyclophilin family peptidyl-prolyl cis-trans isomerase